MQTYTQIVKQPALSYFWAQMVRFAVRFLIVIAIACFAAGCANIIPPEGGKKDETPPKITSVSPPDSALNTRVTKIDLHFNEYVTLDNPSKEIQVSPVLPFPVEALSYGKRVVVKIPDSLLKPNTTYRVSFGQSIKDLHESNPLQPYTYVFSTGSYFDSLKLGGIVYDAATGLPDGEALVVLHEASKPDSAVVRDKPVYVTRTATGGIFQFDGLPDREYQVFAMHDANNNMTYDGKGEKIAFIDSVVRPSDSVDAPVVLKVFEELIVDTLLPKETARKPSLRQGKRSVADEKTPLVYTIAIDTGTINKRTFDITKPVVLAFNRKVDTINRQRVFLSYDSSGIAVESEFKLDQDTSTKDTLLFSAPWKEDAVYTLRLLKGFAKDSAGAEVMPAKFIFRTKNDDDYAKLEVHLPGKYKGTDHMLMLVIENDTVYNKPITDTVVNLTKLRPGEYKMRVIKDKNRNGKWDTGNLFDRIQPEEVVPYLQPLQLKAGWSNIVDFEPKQDRPGASPGKRDKPMRK